MNNFELLNTKTILLICLLGISQLLTAQLRIEAENFSASKGIQTEGTSDIGGGINVGWIDNTDWVKYEIDLPIGGNYEVSLRTASLSGGGIMNLLIDDVKQNSVNISSTGDWQNWTTITSSVFHLNEGKQTLKLYAQKGGFNLNWIEIKYVDGFITLSPPKPEIISQHATEHDITVTWKSSKTEQSPVTGYKILNFNEPYSVISDTGIILNKLKPETNFEFQIIAVDIAGNHSEAALVNIATLKPNWELIWSDEFDGDNVDLSKWNYHIGPNNANNEEQYYTNGENASVENGILTMEARIEYKSGYRYTSSKVFSQNKGDWKYGRVEVSAKMPSAGGTWPAIWMMPTESNYGGWPNSGEIDVLEHVGNNLGWAFGTVHTGAYNHKIGTQKGGGMTIKDVHTAFHSYIIEWYPDRIDFYFDDIHYFTFDNDYKTSMEWPFDQKFYLILNIAVGGDLGGNVNHNATWPAKMEVDYVRVYDLNFGANDTITPPNPANITSKEEGTSISLNWDRVIDNEFVKHYLIYLDGELYDSTSASNYQALYLDPETAYDFAIQAVDFGNNKSDLSSYTASTTKLHSTPIPGKIQAEDYIYMEGIDTEETTDTGGGTNVGWIDPNDWMEYSIDVETAGNYYFAARVAAQEQSGKLVLIDQDENILTELSTPRTGGWQKWETIVSESFHLNAGIQRIKIKALKKGTNINWFNISDNESGGLTNINSIKANFHLYPNPLKGNTLHIKFSSKVSNAQAQITSVDGRIVYNKRYNENQSDITLNNLNLKKGVYVVHINSDKHSGSYKLLVE